MCVDKIGMYVHRSWNNHWKVNCDRLRAEGNQPASTQTQITHGLRQAVLIYTLFFTGHLRFTCSIASAASRPLSYIYLFHGIQA